MNTEDKFDMFMVVVRENISIPTLKAQRAVFAFVRDGFAIIHDALDSFVNAHDELLSEMRNMVSEEKEHIVGRMFIPNTEAFFSGQKMRIFEVDTDN